MYVSPRGLPYNIIAYKKEILTILINFINFQGPQGEDGLSVSLPLYYKLFETPDYCRLTKLHQFLRDINEYLIIIIHCCFVECVRSIIKNKQT